VVAVIGDGHLRRERPARGHDTGRRSCSCRCWWYVTDNNVAISVDAARTGAGSRTSRRTRGRSASLLRVRRQRLHRGATRPRGRPRATASASRSRRWCGSRTCRASTTTRRRRTSLRLRQLRPAARLRRGAGRPAASAGRARSSAATRRHEGKDYFRRHDFGGDGAAADDYVVETMAIARASRSRPTGSIFEHIRAPFPAAIEAPAEGRQTSISLNGAIRAAMQAILARTR
jgi:hypothetical protein